MLLVPAVVYGIVVWLTHSHLTGFPALLTATSILTGLIFTMALRFWERSIDARVDPVLAVNGNMLRLLDNLRTHLVWTVFIGVLSTAWLASLAIFVVQAAPLWASAVATALFIYQVTLVAGSLLQFYEASYSLRR